MKGEVKMKRAREVFLVLLVTLGVQLPLLAQSTLGTIVGAIKDQSGAAVPDATINLLNI